MKKYLKNSKLFSIFILSFFSYTHVHADDQLNFHIETPLIDGYYGYTVHQPETTLFYLVKDGKPTIFYPKKILGTDQSGCPPIGRETEYFFKMGINNDLVTKGTLPGDMQSISYKNTEKGNGRYAAASKIRTDQHYPCNGKIINSVD